MNSLKIFTFLIFSIKICQCDWRVRVKQQITKNVNTYQVVTFFSDTLTANSSQRISTIHDHPNIVLSFRDSTLRKEQVFQWSLFKMKSLMQNSLIIFQTNNPDESESFIDFLIQLLSVRKRPKCLIIFFNDSCQVRFESILKYAWKNKFLDFSLITMDSDENLKAPIIYDYNPFYNSLKREYFYQKMQVFPEKLQNVNGFPIRLAKFRNYYPSLLVKNKGKMLKKYFVEQHQIDFILSIMNFSVVKKLINYPSKNLIEWDVNMYCYININSNYSEEFIIPANEPGFKYYAFVPILPKQNHTILSTIFYNLIIITVIVIILIYVSKLLGISKDNLSANHIVTITLGQPVLNTARRIGSRIIHLITTALYIKLISFDLYSSIVKFKFESGQMPFESYKDLDESNFDVYMKSPLFKNHFPNDQHLVNMMQRSRIIHNMTACFDKLIEFKNVICIDHERGVYRVNAINRMLKHPVIKAAQPSLWNWDVNYYQFEVASPYAVKFGEILHRTQEAGLNWMVSLRSRFDEVYHVEEDVNRKFDQGINVEQLLLIIFIGYLLAIPIFFTELIVPKIFH